MTPATKLSENSLIQPQEAKIEIEQVIEEELSKVVFDIPSLIGKNIDEIVMELGESTTYTAPTKQQLEVFDIWSMERLFYDTEQQTRDKWNA